LYELFLEGKTLPSAQVTIWRVLKDKIDTIVNLERCGLVMISTLCVMCGDEEETTSHLFFKCRVA